LLTFPIRLLFCSGRKTKSTINLCPGYALGCGEAPGTWRCAPGCTPYCADAAPECGDMPQNVEMHPSKWRCAPEHGNAGVVASFLNLAKCTGATHYEGKTKQQSTCYNLTQGCVPGCMTWHPFYFVTLFTFPDPRENKNNSQTVHGLMYHQEPS